MIRTSFLFLLTIFAASIFGKFNSVDDIYKHVLNNDKHIPPRNFFTLHVTLKLSMFVEISEVDDKLSTVMLFKMRWIYERFAWKHLNTSDIPWPLKRYVTVNDNRVWRPIQVLHRDKTGGSGRLSKIEGVIYIQENGTVQWVFSRRLDTYCGVNTRFYPFDIQQCLIELSFPDYSNMHLIVDKSDNSNLVDESGNWQILNFGVSTSRNNYFQMFMRIKRKPMRPMLTIVLPVFTLASMAPLVFLIPADSGERIGLSLTTLLAISVYMTIVGEELPKISEPLAIIDMVLFLWFASNACIVLLVILHERICKIMVKKRLTAWLWKRLKVVNKKSMQPYPDQTDACAETKLNGELENEHLGAEEKPSWKELGRLLDKVFLFIIYMMKITLVVTVSIYVASAKQIEPNSPDLKEQTQIHYDPTSRDEDFDFISDLSKQDVDSEYVFYRSDFS